MIAMISPSGSPRQQSKDQLANSDSSVNKKKMIVSGQAQKQLLLKLAGKAAVNA